MKLYLNFVLSVTLFYIVGFASLGFAKAPAEASTELVTSNSKGSEFQLEVRQMPMAQVIGMIARKTNVPIHYSVLPEGLVTATCVGSSLKQVLECLLDRKADIIVRAAQNATNTKSMPNEVAEAWILGSKLAAANSGAGYCVANTDHSPDNQSLMVRESNQSAEIERSDEDVELTNELLRSAQSKNPEERAEAIGALLDTQNNDNPAIKAALEKGLRDESDTVRAQAISSLAGLEGDAALGAIQDALHDTSVDVRLMAVDVINNDIPLLQQAVNDSDETVSALASMKLADLAQTTKGAQ
jgi:hypothetical protein